MKKRYLPIFIAAAVSITAVSAQDQNIPLGYVVRQAEFKITDMYGLSRFDAGLGTARSAAMAGAFTSLGADLSSMNINPAGLGMYRTSEFGITGGLMINGIKNSAPGAFSTSASNTNFGLNNVAVIFNLYEGTGAMTSFTMGFGYNKFADFNYRSHIDYADSNTTILEMFAPVVTNYASEMGHDNLGGNGPWNDAFLEEWGAILAYQTGLVQRATGTDIYNIPGVMLGAGIGQSLRTISKGSAGEYSFSGGWNFSNRFYFGFTIGLTEYYRNREVSFDEVYSNNTPLPPNDAAIDMLYVQNIRTTGEGYNLKLGFIYRPIEELRIGIAIHSPTVIMLNTRYDSRMWATFEDAGNITASTPRRTFTEKFFSPTRLLTGISYTFADRAVLALDYEHTWYNGIRVRSELYSGYWDTDARITYSERYKNDVKMNFAGAHTIRFGGEVMATDFLLARAGFSYVREGLSESLRSGDSIFDVPVEKSSIVVSAGLGYRFSGRTSIDLTYAYSATDYTLYNPYYFQTTDNTVFTMSDPVELNRQRHNIMLSFNYKF